MGTGSETKELSRPIAIGSLAVATLLLLAMRTPSKNWLLDYFPNPAFEGEATTRAWVTEVSLALPGKGLVHGVPDRPGFSLRLQSCLPLSTPSDVAFGLRADDHARLYVDGNLIVDTARPNPPVERGRNRRARRNIAGKKHLALQSGSHLLAIEYSNTGGQAALHFDMNQKGGAPSRLQASLQRPNLDGRCEPP